MPTIDATWGGTASNSYVSLEETQTYVESFKLSTELDNWTKAEEEDIEIALIRASSDINNQYTYVGNRREVNQHLEFPRRLNIYDFAYASTDPNLSDEDEMQLIMKERVQRACIEQAFGILNKAGDSSADLHRQRQNYGIRGYSENLGPVGEHYQYGSAGDFLEICPKSYDYLKWYIANPGLVRGGAFDSYLR